MASLFTPDNIATLVGLLIAAVVVAVFVAVVMTVPPDAGSRYMAGRRYHRDGKARHARRVDPDATTPMSALTTVPDGGPFAPRTI